MRQLFSPITNIISKATLFGAVFFLAGLALLLYFYVRTPYATGVNMTAEQPVPFSHAHHVGELEIDCRYCHVSVTDSSFAGMPSTETCMTCHTHIWVNSPQLAEVRDSWQSGVPIEWVRIHDLPDHVYFDHSVHVTKGVGCETCHGRVDQMPLVWKAESLGMTWCLECHRDPGRFLRPREEIFTAGYEPDEAQSAVGHRLIDMYHTPTDRLTDCYACHR